MFAALSRRDHKTIFFFQNFQEHLFCRTSTSNASLKLPLFDVQNIVSLFWNYSLNFSVLGLHCPEKFTEVQKHVKNCTSNYSLKLPINETENLRHRFVTTPLLFQTHISPSTCCWWLSKKNTQKSGFKELFKSKITWVS